MPNVLERASVTSVAELAESSGVRECLQWFTRERQWVHEQHTRVVRSQIPPKSAAH